MYLFYIDESGTPDPVSIHRKGGCSKKFIIGGILIKTDYYSYMHLLKHGTNFQVSDKFKYFLPSIAFSDSKFV